MAFIGFDLDETLGSFGPLHNHILFLTPEEVYKNLLPEAQPFVPSESLRRKLKVGLKAFAACLVGKDSELGILRKGILKIMRRLAEAKANGHVRALSIYSNNGNVGLLLLASEMIEQAVGAPELFCNHIDWYNPLRATERTPGRPGTAMKTAAVLRKGFVNPKCPGIESVADVPVGRLYFFDDVEHMYMKPIIGPDHYFQVKAYKQEVVDLKPVDECLDAVLRSSGLAEDETYLAYVKPILAGLDTSTNRYEDILATVKRLNAKYQPVRHAFADDTDELIRRIDSIFPPINYGENYFPVVDGGKRRNQKRRRMRVRKTFRKQKSHHKTTRKN